MVLRFAQDKLCWLARMHGSEPVTSLRFGIQAQRDGRSRGVAQLVARLHGVQEVRSSNLLTPTPPSSSEVPYPSVASGMGSPYPDQLKNGSFIVPPDKTSRKWLNIIYKNQWLLR